MAMLGIALTLMLSPNALQAAQRHVIICGSGGDAEYQEKFNAWADRLQNALVNQLGHPAESVVLLAASAQGATTPTKTLDLAAIQAALQTAARELGAEDELLVYLIGHGSHWRGVSRFHIPGPDLTADELARLIEPLSARRFVLIDAASTSAGFINALSQTGRVICTASKSVEEKNATEFMEYFIQALEEGSADRNRDERVSVLEACRQAADLTEAHYVGAGLIATEHALLDDNGDGLGTRLAGDMKAAPAKKANGGAPAAPDGAAAAQCFLKDFTFPPAAPRELVERYLSLLNQVEDLKAKKSTTPSAAYYTQLETLLIQAAQTHRQIRHATPTPSTR